MTPPLPQLALPPRLTALSSLAALVLLTLLPALSHAADPDLPQPLNPQEAAPLLQSPPFTRVLDLSDTLMLTGIAYVNGKPVATLSNKTTKETYLVSETPNAQGWKLTSASVNNEPRLTQVKLLVGTEEVTVHYNEAQLTPTNKGFSAFRPPSADQFTGHDEDGKPYVKGSVYLSEEDRDIYHNSMSKEAHDQFRQIIRDNRDKMFAASPEERAAYVKQVFDKVNAQDRSQKK